MIITPEQRLSSKWTRHRPLPGALVLTIFYGRLPSNVCKTAELALQDIDWIFRMDSRFLFYLQCVIL
jgi:hypothetical protein